MIKPKLISPERRREARAFLQRHGRLSQAETVARQRREAMAVVVDQALITADRRCRSCLADVDEVDPNPVLQQVTGTTLVSTTYVFTLGPCGHLVEGVVPAE